jgi:hypothetical protein
VIRIAFLAFSAVILVACASTPSPVPSTLTWHPEADVRGLMTDVVLDAERNASGGIDFVTVRGLGAMQRRSIEWSITFIDDSGRTVPGLSDRFRRFTVVPGVPFQLEAISPVDNAVRASIHLRSSRSR